MHGVVGIYNANSVGDDIEVYTDDTKSTVSSKFFTLGAASSQLIP